MLEKGKRFAKIEELIEIINEQAEKEEEKGTFTCPYCGGKAYFEFFEHYDPAYPKEKESLSMGITAFCENACFTLSMGIITFCENACFKAKT